MAPGNFEFIITDQENRSIDGKAREKIRKRAMSATAAARKGSGTWGKQNRRQVPVFVDASDEPAASSTAPAPAAVHVKSEPTSDDARTTTAPPSSSSSSSSSASSSSSSTPVSAPDSQVVARRRQLVRPPRPMPDMGLETVTSRTGMNILDLSALTIVQVGRTASAILGMPTKELSSLISRRRRSYLSFVPSRYGHSPFLDEAIRCLAIRSRRVLVPSARPPETFEMMQYGRALQSLQAAVNGEGWTSPDVLCAVEILSMFELLESRRSEAWERHIAGAARLIQMRGPMRFLSAYEMALLLSLLGPMVFECCRLNQACFLDEPPWQRLLRFATAHDELISARSPIAIASWCIFIKFPRHLRDVTNLINGGTENDLTTVYERVLAFRAELHQWRKDFDAVIAVTGNARVSRSDADVRAELLGANLGLLAATNRCLGSLSGTDLPVFEAEAAECAMTQRQLALDVLKVNPWAAFYLRQITNFTEATFGTAKLFMNQPQRPGHMVGRDKFNIWRDLLFRNAAHVPLVDVDTEPEPLPSSRDTASPPRTRKAV